VICTFTNTRRGTITVTKETLPASDPQDFAFTTTGGGLSAFSLDTDVADTAFPASRSFTLVPGQYSLTETLPIAGWDFTRVACISASGTSTVPAPSTSSASVSVALAAGYVVACTYRNTKRAGFAVVKTVAGQPPTATQGFDFEVRNGATPSSVGTTIGSGRATAANGGLVTIGTAASPATPLLVAPGTYQFCEFILPGWGNPLGTSSFVPGLALDSTADNAFLCVNVTVAAGANQTFTLDNRPPPGGQAKTIGFWKNWASCSGSKGKQKPVLDQTLAAASATGGVTIGTLTLNATDCSKAVSLLSKQNINTGKSMSSDEAFNLAAQLLAAKLDVVAGAGTCPAAVTAINNAQALLAAIQFNGATHNTMTAAQKTQANSLATTLDAYNNNKLC
jgi:hypothetical protein